MVTGGSSGIGKAVVSAFHQNQVELCYADITAANEQETGQFVQADLTKPHEVESFCNECTKRIGTPDILVLNAGRGIRQTLEEGDPAQWEYIIQLNVLSALRLIRHFLPAMKKKEHADVVLISSVSSFHPYPTGAIYSATKAAVENIAEVLRLENLPQIRVTTLAPGVVDTNFFRNNIDGTDDVESLNMGAVQPEEVADAIIYCLTRRRDISINYMVIRPTQQEM